MRSLDDGLLLVGSDAGNPLGFLTALGTLRVATLVWPERPVRMAWERHGVGWRPRLYTDSALDQEALVEGLHRYCRYGMCADGSTDGATLPAAADAFPYFAFDQNTSKITPDRFAELACEAVGVASTNDRAFADYLAAFGCEACVDDDYIADTALRTMSGQGHQHFLATMMKLTKAVEPRHIRAALLEPWRYTDPVRGFSMRWDPLDDRRYALQWRDPSKDPDRGRRGSMLGANRLAVESLPLLPTMPVMRGGKARLSTTGFDMRREPRWVWPVWVDPISLDVCGSLLSHKLLQEIASGSAANAETDTLRRERLRRMGIQEIFCSRRISVEYFRNFTPAVAV